MSPMLEDDLRATLAAHAHDVSPGPQLTQAAVGRAARIRRTKRLKFAAGGVAVVGAVALVPLLASVGRTDHTAPPIQPHPSVSAEPVPEAVVQQARETHALMAAPTAIVDGGGAEVVTVQVPLEVHAGFTNRIDYVSRAAGGYVVTSGASLTANNAPPHTINFVRPDGTTILLGSPRAGGVPVLSSDGLLVAFEGVPANVDETLLVVTNLDGQVLHQRTGPGVEDVRAVSGSGLWYSCAGPSCAEGGDNAPYYWDFASDTVSQLPIEKALFWAAQSGDQMVFVDNGGTPTLVAYDVSNPAAPRLLWRTPATPSRLAFDGAGDLLLVTDGRGKAVSIDTSTGTVIDSADVATQDPPVWTANGQWLMYGEPGGTADLPMYGVTPDGQGSLAVDPHAFPPASPADADHPAAYAILGLELPPPARSGG